MDGAWDAESISEEAVIGYAEFTAGLEQAEHSVASGLAGLADGSSGDFSLGDDGADVVFRSVSVKRDLGPVEDAQKIRPELVQAYRDPDKSAIRKLSSA